MLCVAVLLKAVPDINVCATGLRQVGDDSVQVLENNEFGRSALSDVMKTSNDEIMRLLLAHKSVDDDEKRLMSDADAAETAEIEESAVDAAADDLATKAAISTDGAAEGGGGAGGGSEPSS